MTNSLFESLFVGVSTLSIARWKARGRLPIRDNWTFSLAIMVEQILVDVDAIQMGVSLWPQILGETGRRTSTIAGVRKLECFATS